MRRSWISDAAAFKDSYQVLRAGLMVALDDTERPRVMVTSPSASEGKTTTCVNLALCCAKAGQRVVIVDLDLRHPDAHRLIGGHNNFGVTDLLTEKRSTEECLQFIPSPGTNDHGAAGVYFLGTGPAVDNAAELLSLERTARTMELIAQQADLVLIDTPPVLSVADTLVSGRLVSGALLVVQGRRTKWPDVARAKKILLRHKIRVFGLVLNEFDPRDGGYWEVPAADVDTASETHA